MAHVIACGFYTGDYAEWTVRLLRSLDAVHQEHDFVQVPKRGGGWEAETMMKATHILAAMDRHPDKVIAWLDVDCVVRGSLEPLSALTGDVSFRMRAGFRKRKGAKFSVQSGTIVLKPTPGARRYVELWKKLSDKAAYGEIDQTTQMVAMARSVGTSFVPLPHAYCVNHDEKGAVTPTIVQHDSAALGEHLMSRWSRYVGRLISRRAA